MTTTQMINIVRKRMDDTGVDALHVARRNTFYSNEEILLCLNMAQDMVVDYIVETQDIHLLSFLLSDVPIKRGDVFPSDYLYHSEGYVLDAQAVLYRGEVMLGATAIPYINDYKTNTTIGIINNVIYHRYPDYRLYYYKYPPAIVVNGDNIAFQDDTYLGVVCELGSTILGFKEPQTQREFKNKMVASANRAGINANEISFSSVLEMSRYFLKLLMGQQNVKK